MIPYGRQSIGQDDIDAVRDVLASGWITQGPKVLEFEQALAAYCGAKYAVVSSSGTAALHAAYNAIGIGPGDEVISSPITFPATLNAAVWQGGVPVLADVLPGSGNIDPEDIERKITKKTKAIAPVDYTGMPVDLDRIHAIAQKHKLAVVEDACQALGASYKGKKIGSLSDITTFSFHPVKSITTGEGGASLTNDETLYKKMKSFVTHGVVKEGFVYDKPGDWYFEQQELGLNYRLTDFQSALGLSQLKKLDTFIEKRRAIAEKYAVAFEGNSYFDMPPMDSADVRSAWHLYVIRLKDHLLERKSEIFAKLREQGIGVQVHHVPVHHHPYYAKFGLKPGMFPVAEKFYHSAISLPIYPDLSEREQESAIETVMAVMKQYV